MIDAGVGPIAVWIWEGLSLLEDLYGGIAVVFNPLSLGLGAVQELVFHGASDIKDIGNRPGVVERLHDEERIADVSDQVLSKHTHVLSLRELGQAFWCWWASLLVAELEESGIRIAEGIGLTRKIQSINENARIRYQPILCLLQLWTQIISPKVNSQATSRSTTEHYLTSLRVQAYCSLEIVESLASDVVTPEIEQGILVLDRVDASALVTRAITVVEEHSGPVEEVIGSLIG